MFELIALFATCIRGYVQSASMQTVENSEDVLLVGEYSSYQVGEAKYLAETAPVLDTAQEYEMESDLESTERVHAGAKEAAADGPNTQQLVFGSYHKDSGVEVHYCDVLLKPQRTISSVTVFLKTNENDPNAAVPKCMITPKSSPSGKGFVRLELNDGSIQRDGSLYNFQITCSDGTVLNTETWTFDSKTGKFSHASAVKRPFYTKKLFKIIAGSFLAVALLILSFAIYRSLRKSKATI